MLESSCPQTYPRRVICLTDETTELMYLLGQQDRLVGVSGFSVRPPEARLKPRVSSFLNAKFDKIVALQPDIVFTFSDLQADIARELIGRGIPVLAFNQRSVPEIFESIHLLGRVLNCGVKATELVGQLQAAVERTIEAAKGFPFRPKVFFEEWKDPLISGIRWVEDLVSFAGGDPIFPELHDCHAATDRIVSPAQVVARNPDVIIASWCGTKVNREQIRSRPGWNGINAVRQEQIYEIKSTYILQPGPAAISEGLPRLHRIFAHVTGVETGDAGARWFAGGGVNRGDVSR